MRRPALDAASAPARARRVRRIQRWHRALGLSIAVLVAWLSLSGLLLMHGDTLGLARRHVASAWLLEWYGIRPPTPPRGFESGGRWLSQYANLLFLDDRSLGPLEGTLLGVYADPASPGETIVASDTQLVIIDAQGQVLERIGREGGFPAAVTALGRARTGLVLRAGNRAYAYDGVSGEFVEGQADDAVQWSVAALPPARIVDAVRRHYRGDGLPLERVLLDLHSGRLLGPVGVICINLASLGLLALAATGIYTWIVRRLPKARPGAPARPSPVHSNEKPS
ncbi:MAG: PepSY domain-containing protein [Gammaproteobacteria bacterium]